MRAVIDVGSNSVRLLLADNGEFKKEIKVTKLAEGLALTGRLNETAIARTADAVNCFYNKAQSLRAKSVYVFATAAVRRAVNGYEFVDRVKSLCGITVDVISGEIEARCGLDGVLKGKDGGIIDIGGASTEITVRKNGEIVYSKSLDIGGVRILDKCAQDVEKIYQLTKEKVKEYGDVPASVFYGIGGTATSILSVYHKLRIYDKNVVHGSKIDRKILDETILLFASKTVEERKNIIGLQPERADVILGTTILLKAIFEHLNLDNIFVSEDDNLEGYLYLKGELYE